MPESMLSDEAIATYWDGATRFAPGLVQDQAEALFRAFGLSASDAARAAAPLLTADIGGETVTFQIDREGVGYRLRHGGAEAVVKVLSRRASELNALMPEKVPPDLSKFLLSPMPGLLVSVAVEPGQQVRAGEELAVVEAMKMENILHAVADATVKEICAEPGDGLAVDQVILEFE